MHVDTSKKTLSVPELDIYEKVSNRFNLDKAKEKALDLVKEKAISSGTNPHNIDAEITEESSFNMVRYSTLGRILG